MTYTANYYLNLADKFFADDERRKAKANYLLAYRTAYPIWEQMRSYASLDESARALMGVALTADSDSEALVAITDALGFGHVLLRDAYIHGNDYASYHECLRLLKKMLVHETEDELQQKISGLLDVFFLRHPELQNDFRLKNVDKSEEFFKKKTNR